MGPLFERLAGIEHQAHEVRATPELDPKGVEWEGAELGNLPEALAEPGVGQQEVRNYPPGPRDLASVQTDERVVGPCCGCGEQPDGHGRRQARRRIAPDGGRRAAGPG